MINRYCTRQMSKIWPEAKKFSTWLKVELAIIEARVQMGIFPEEALEIREKASFCSERLISFGKGLGRKLCEALKKGDISQEFEHLLNNKLCDLIAVERIGEIEKEVDHDLLAFVRAVQESLPEELRKYFHADITSYDVEEPAFSLRIIEAMRLVRTALDELAGIVCSKANEYRYLPRMAKSHGQSAEPNTLGLVFLGWYDSLQRQIPLLVAAENEMCFSKISGAVGTYPGGLSPELEERALALLGLKPADFSSQTILRDRHANVINALAVLAGVMENMALNVWLLSQTGIDELQEPFKEKQKGSSRMPHKRNPIKSENLRGLAGIVKNYPAVVLGTISTCGARDISQSSIERIVFPDAFQLTHFMLRRMKGIMEGIVVNEENIKHNLETTDVFFSPDVKEALMKEGVGPEKAYRIAQETAFEAVKTKGRNAYRLALARHPDVPENVKGRLGEIFNLDDKLKNVDNIFLRFGL